MRPFLAAAITFVIGLTITQTVGAQPKGSIVHRVDTLKVQRLPDGKCDWSELTIPDYPRTTSSVLLPRDEKTCTMISYIVTLPNGPSGRLDTARATRDTLVRPAVIYTYPQRFEIDSAPKRPDSNTVTILDGRATSAASFRRADSIFVVDVIRKNFGDRKHQVTGVQLFGDSAAVQATMGSMHIRYKLDRKNGLWLKRDREEITVYKHGYPD